MQIVFVTGNKNKLAEVEAILLKKSEGQPLKFELSNHALNLDEIQNADPKAVATHKAKQAFQIIQKPVLVEDTCLCFESMQGLPGPFIKFFLEKLKPEGLCHMLDGFPSRRGYALCTFALCLPAEDSSPEVLIFQGRTDGQIVVEPRGPQTFGWDSTFQPDGLPQTFAEMTKETKNSVSHRYRALDKLLQHFK